MLLVEKEIVNLEPQSPLNTLTNILRLFHFVCFQKTNAHMQHPLICEHMIRDFSLWILFQALHNIGQAFTVQSLDFLPIKESCKRTICYGQKRKLFINTLIILLYFKYSKS